MKTIGGILDHAALAVLHRPADPAALAREGSALIGLGLSVADAAQALRMTPRALAVLLAEFAVDETERRLPEVGGADIST